MNKPRVLVTRIILPEGLDLVHGQCEVDLWQDELPIPRSELLRRIQGMDGVLSLLTDRIDAEVMDAAGPSLRVISNMAVGYDNIDVPTATARRIPVGNTPGVLTDATADFAFTLLLAAARRVVEAARYVQVGQWKSWGPSTLLGVDLVGATLGIVGYGRIGRAVAKRAAGFDMRILYHDPGSPAADPFITATPVDFETLLREADFVSVHTPLTPQTRHLINERAFSLMKPTAILVNTARGAVVDPDALYQVLKTNRIFAAALDVTDPEPLPPDSPLLTLDNLIVAPHIASANRTTRGKMSAMAAENLLAGLLGERLPNCANPEVYS